MSNFDIIHDPESGKLVNIDGKRGLDVLQTYSDVSGRTKLLNNKFFKFREYEFESLRNIIYPFLRKVLNDNLIADYINSHMNCDIYVNQSLHEINVNKYMDCFNKFKAHIDKLIVEYNNYNSIDKLNVKLNIGYERLE